MSDEEIRRMGAEPVPDRRAVEENGRLAAFAQERRRERDAWMLAAGMLAAEKYDERIKRVECVRSGTTAVVVLRHRWVPELWSGTIGEIEVP
jgi:hypothetical protein